jgi:hypothetical protein
MFDRLNMSVFDTNQIGFRLFNNMSTVPSYYRISAVASTKLSANLNLNSHTLYNPTGNVQLTLTTASSGGSGVYVTNTQTANAELATKAKAVAYSIVFG